MSTGFLKKLGYSVLIGFIVMVVVTEVLQREIEFSLFVGIPAGALAGILALWAQIRS